MEDPALRPSIEKVQRHACIHHTDDDYPIVSLATLVNAYGLWETQGGSRRSLFSAGGVPEPTQDDSPTLLLPGEGWNFSATDEHIDLNESDAQVVYDAYGPDVDISPRQDSLQPPRRRLPPPNLKAFKVPLEKVFDPHTLSNYDENARAFYGRTAQPSTAALPLRNDSEQQPSIRESLIDLDLSLDGGDLSQFAEMETVKAGPRPATSNVEQLDRRRTQDWKFPSMTPASASPGILSFEYYDDYQSPIPSPAPTPRDDGHSMALTTPQSQPNRSSVISLIDLDAGLVEDLVEPPRPSTAGSNCESTSSDLGQAPF